VGFESVVELFIDLFRRCFGGWAAMLLLGALDAGLAEAIVQARKLLGQLVQVVEPNPQQHSPENSQPHHRQALHRKSRRKI
jgi:hypothetical protein